MTVDRINFFGTYRAWEAFDKTWFISFKDGTQNMYLLEGSAKALLIDTGYGAGNLRAFVEKLTDKPIIVVNTHFHRDHAAGNGEFEEVLVHPHYDLDAAEWEHLSTLPFRLDSLPFPNYRKSFLHDEDCIDLGDRLIEVWQAKPAHCNSSLFLLDRTRRLIFTGDELEAGQVLFLKYTHCDPIVHRLKNMQHNIEKMLAYCGEFDVLLPNHNGFPIAKSYLSDYYSLIDRIFDGTAVVMQELGHPVIEKSPIGAQLCRVRYGRVSFFMDKTDAASILA